MAWHLPTDRDISQPWGAEFDDWNGDGIVDYPGGFYHSIGWDGHNGIDYKCRKGDPVYAVADGTVEFADWGNRDPLMSGGGNAIRISHPQAGVRSGYLHLSEFLVTQGQRVSGGQIIARSGSTGASTAPHLHLEFFPLGDVNQRDRWRGRIDPTPYLYPETISTQGFTDFPQVIPEQLIDEDPMKIVATNGVDGKVYVGDGLWRRHVWTMDTKNGLDYLIALKGLGPFYKDGEIQTIPDLNILGIDMEALAGKI